MKFDEDVLKMMNNMKRRKKMKFSMNFWVWSLCEFCFLILVGPSNFVTQHTERHINVVCHVTRCPHDQNQNVYNKKDIETKTKNT